MGVLFTVIPLFLVIYGCQGRYFFNLMQEFQLNAFRPADLPKGTTSIDGPPSVPGSKAIQLGSDIDPIFKRGGTFGYLTAALSRSTDFTFHTWFRVTKKFDKVDEKWPLLVLGNKKLEHRYFGVGFTAEYIDGGTVVEGEVGGGNKKLGYYIYVEKYEDKQRLTHVTRARIDSSLIKPNTWIRLMVRIRTTDPKARRKRRETDPSKKIARVTVTLDCKEVANFLLKKGGFEEYVLSGYASLGMELAIRSTDERVIPKDIFPGAVFRPEVINGKYAFEFYSRCDADFGLQDIPSEPKPNEYNTAKIDLFQKLSSVDVEPVYIYCQDKVDNQQRFNGESWKTTCTYNTCNNNVITTKYTCEQCTAANSGKKYKRGESWISETDACKRKTCELGFKEYTEEKITCVKPVCDKFGTVSPAETGECCEKCARDNCKGGKVYTDGCERRCSDGYDFKCSKEKTKPGCYCPKGQVLDDDGKCIKIETCECKSGNKVYQPGQTAIRSSCSTCVCSSGSMRCFDRCGNS